MGMTEYDARSMREAAALSRKKDKEMVFTKTIYDYRAKSQKVISEILMMEIEQLKQLNPDYQFKTVLGYKLDKTGGAEYSIMFLLKEESANEIPSGICW